MSEEEDIWYCQECEKEMPLDDYGYSRHDTCFCSEECADNYDARL